LPDLVAQFPGRGRLAASIGHSDRTYTIPATLGQLVGEFARRVQDRLRAHLADQRPDYDWTVEATIAGTPVDVVGRAGETVLLVELEWRRADPADNAAKLFRYLARGDLDVERAVVRQVFTGYYDLASGGVSAKRENAEFVGGVAADDLATLSYEALDLAIDPPKRGGEPPPGWEAAVADAAAAIAASLP